MMRLSTLPTGSSAFAPTSQEASVRSIECRVASSDALPDHGVIYAIRPDLDLVVVAVHRLGDERKPDDADPRVEGQLRVAANRPGQPIFGVDGGAEVDTDGADRHRGHGRYHTDQQLAHPRHSGPRGPAPLARRG